MSNPEALLSELNSRGVLLHANGDRLEYDAPAGAIGDLLPEFARLKFDLLELLARDDAPAHRWRDESRDVAAAMPDVATPAATGSDRRKTLVLSGQTVVVNIHRDKALIDWAKKSGLAVWIMRGSAWGNEFKIGVDGTRDEVCDKFAAKLENSPALKARIGELRGKFLVCCCTPQRCHGDLLARLANALPDVPSAPTFAAPGDFTAPDAASATTGSAAAPDVPVWAAPGLSRQQQWRAARLDGQRQARERRAIEAQSTD